MTNGEPGNKERRRKEKKEPGVGKKKVKIEVWKG